MKADDSVKLLRTFWKSEIIASRLYGFLAERYRDDARRESIIELGKIELGHSNVWRNIAKEVYDVSFDVSMFLKFEIVLMKTLALILPFTIFVHYMEHQERHAILEYSKLLEGFKDEEKISKMITNVIRQEIGHEWQMMEQIAEKESYILKAKEAIHGMSAGVLETVGLVIGLLAVHTTTLIIGMTGLIATIGGMIAIMSISYISAKGHYDLHEGRISELSVKKEVHPSVLREELENVLVEEGISGEAAKNMMDAIGDDVGILSKFLKAIKSSGEAVVPKEAVVTTSTFFVMGTLPILIPFFVGVVWDSDPIIPAIFAFIFALIIVSIAGLFIGVLSGKKISAKVIHNIVVITGTCTATYLVGLAARYFFGIQAGH
ncbi:MAG: VIT1/CCC1 transporter family protein [Deltaproteobacteria bacterium]